VNIFYYYNIEIEVKGSSGSPLINKEIKQIKKRCMLAPFYTFIGAAIGVSFWQITRIMNFRRHY
jgi:hypothetical protein